MKLYNIVKVYTSTVGTGTVTLGSAVPSFITFATAGVITGSTVSYAIEDGNNREVGTGVYTSGAETLTRTVVTSTNSNNAITLSGNAVVFITGLAADLSSDTAATANTLVIRNGSGNFALGTPTSGTLTNCTGLPVSTGISGLGANVATFLATPSSANLASAVTDETGTGALVFANTPTLVTPLLGTPTSGTLTNCTGLPISTGVSGLAANVATFLATPSSANLAAALTDETGTGANVFANTPTLVTPILGTPTSGTLTNCTGLPISTGVSGLGSNVATFLATPSSANLASAVTDETGSGALVFGTSPTIATPTITTSATVPLVIGGTGTTSTLTLRSTSGVGTTGADIIFQAGNNGATEVMRLQNGGNVGIGTASPGGKLTIVSGDSATASNQVIISGGRSVSSGAGAILFTNSFWNSGFGAANIVGLDSGASGGHLSFGTLVDGGGASGTPTEKMRILQNGNVGIGTTSPGRLLDVRGLSAFSDGTQGLILGPYTVGSGYSAIYNFGTTPGSANYVFASSTSETILNNATRLVFAIGASEKMRIDSSGNVGIGTASPGNKLHVSGGDANGWVTFIDNSNNNARLQIGSRVSNSASLQSVRIDTAAQTDLVLQPIAGNVAIGSSAAARKLTVYEGTAGTADVGVRVEHVSNKPAYMEFVTTQRTANFGLGSFSGPGFTGAMQLVCDGGFHICPSGTGDVGIGTASPAALLHVASGTTTSLNLARIYAGSLASGSAVDMYIGKAASPNQSGTFGFHYNSTSTSSYAYISIYGDSATTGITVTPGGKVGIGKQQSTYSLEISADSAAKPGAGGLWTVVSDERIKTNIIPADLDRCYEIVKSVPLKHYGFAPGVYGENQIQDKHNLGWIAQDVQKVFKNAVSTKPFTLHNNEVIQDCLDLNSGQLIAALYGAVQSLMQKVEELQRKI